MKTIYNKHLCHTEAKVSVLWSLSLFLGYLPRGSDLSIVCKISMLWYFTFFLSLHFLDELQEKDVTPRHGRCCCCYYGCPPPGSLFHISIKRYFPKSQSAWLCVCCCWSCLWLFAIPWTIKPTRLLCPWDFPGKNTRVGCHFPVYDFSI